MASKPTESRMSSAPKAGWRRVAGPLLILLAAAVATAPQLIRGDTCGHDFDFHLVSWFDCLSSWRHGILYPQWTQSANYGAGEPRFIFYPPLTWMLGGALGAMLPWRFVPIALTFLLLAATGLATQALAARVMARMQLPEGAATLAGCAALFSGYALFTAYERSAFGELAGFWIPLLLLLMLRERRTGAGLMRQAFDGSAAWLAVVVAGAWLSNAPLGVMASYLLAAVALLLAAMRRSWAPLLRAAAGVTLGLGLAAFYLVPAAYEQRWVDIHQATDDPGLMIQNSFLFGHATAPGMEAHNAELTRVSWIAAAMIGVALFGLLVAWRRGRLRGEWSRWLPLALIPAAVLVLLLPFSQPVWNLLPKLRFLQFPWRWLVVVEAPMAVLFAAAVWPRAERTGPSELNTKQVPSGAEQVAEKLLGSDEKCQGTTSVVPQVPQNESGALAPEAHFSALESRTGPLSPTCCEDLPASKGRGWQRLWVSAACAAFFLGSTAIAGIYFFQPCDDEDAVAPMVQVDQSGAGFEGVYEYEPIGADDGVVATGLAGGCLVSNPHVTLGVLDTQGANPDWWVEQRSCDAIFSFGPESNPEHLRLGGPTPHAGYLILRLRTYPAWRITVNGQPASSLERDDGLIVVPVSQGPVEVDADWTETADVKAGRALTALALVLVTGLGLLERRRDAAARSHLS